MGKPSPPDTLPTVQEPAAKFVWLTGPVLGKIQAERLAELIWSADEWGAPIPFSTSAWRGADDRDGVDPKPALPATDA